MFLFLILLFLLILRLLLLIIIFFVAAGRCHVQPDQAYLFPVTALLEGVALSGTHPLAELGRKKYGLNLPKCNYLSALGGELELGRSESFASGPGCTVQCTVPGEASTLNIFFFL